MTSRPVPPGREPDGDPIGEDVDAELRFHLEARAEALESEGMTPADARARARDEFGDLEDARQDMRRSGQRVLETPSWRFDVSTVIQDIRYAFRQIRNAPTFAAAAILTLALGIGANAAIFSVVNGVVFRPLPFPDSGQLYKVYSANRSAGIVEGGVSPVDLDDWRERRQDIADIGGFWYAEGSSGVNLMGRGTPRRLASVFFTPGFLEALGVQPSVGRLPREDELVRGGDDRIVMLTHGFWLREFGGEASAVGSTLTLGGEPFRVIGVLPETMRYPAASADVMVPYSTIPDSSIPRLRQVRVLDVVARAKPGVPVERVRAEMTSIAQALAATYPENESWDGATVLPLADVVIGPVRRGLLVLFGAVGLVLLLTCVNVAALQLARASGRSREMALRLALGARPGRLVQQLLTESLLLALAGGALGLLVARFGLTSLLALSAGQLPRAGEIALDATVVAFTAAVSIATGVLFGLLPAWRAAHQRGALTVREGGRSVAGRGHNRWRLALIVAEVAVAMILIVGAGLMGRSFMQLTQVDLGFRGDNLLAVQFTLDPDRFGRPAPDAPPDTPQPYTIAYQEIIDRVRAIPGVEAAGAVKDPPFRGIGERWGFTVAGRPPLAGEDDPTATAIHVSEGYFETIGARVVEGREYTARDRLGAPFVLVVNEAFARQYFPDEDAAGKSLVISETPIKIVGVVNDIRQVSVGQAPPPLLYIHNLQNPRVKTTVVARTAGDPLQMTEAVQQAIWSVDPQQPITSIFTFDDAVSRALAQPRLLTVLLGGFGLVGLMLGAVGVYGLLASLVNEQRREFGLRLALGARPGQVLSSVVRRGAGVTLAGMVIGLAGAVALSRFMASVLYGIEPLDPPTFLGMAAMLLLVAMLASWLPARRAAALDPAETLRAD